MNPSDNNPQEEKVDRAILALRSAPVPDGPPPEVVASILAAGQEKASHHTPLITRMRSMNRVTKIAAALAATFLLVGGGVALLLTLGGPGATTALADAIKELNVHTARFIMTTVLDPLPPGAPPAQKMEVLWSEPGLMRCNTDMVAYQVMDLKAGKFVMFMPEQKKVMVIAMKGRFKAHAGPGIVVVGAAEDPSDKPDENDFFGNLRQKIKELRASRDQDVEALGEKVINGRRAIGFHKAHDEKAGDLEVWADVETHMPALVIMSVGTSPRAKITMSDFEFDVPLDPALFSTEIPPGFTVDERTIDASVPTEAEFVAGLRTWAESLGGEFPPALDINAAQDALAKMVKKMAEDAVAKATQQGVYKTSAQPQEAGSPPTNADKPGEPTPTGSDAAPEMPSQETLNEAMKFQRVIMFVMKLTQDKIDWHYAGKGVRLGDAATPIFWYRPAGSATYRVISGALDVSDAAPEALPSK
jgi:outer membrane lipoprotein-sorting protein